MLEVLTGNFNNERDKYRGWVVGNFIDKASPFHTEDFEIKWIKVAKGFRKENLGPETKAKSLAILISGKYQISLLTTDQKFLLEKEGDYLFYQPTVPHRAEAFEDTLMIAIRWPSLPHDQQPQPVQ
ncbi:MAG: hypothetical protein Q8N84_03105 [bacterium]|nr:hypothetical protein [bacterium]